MLSTKLSASCRLPPELETEKDGFGGKGVGGRGDGGRGVSDNVPGIAQPNVFREDLRGDDKVP